MDDVTDVLEPEDGAPAHAAARRVLLVDADPARRQATAGLLGQLGYDVSLAASSDDAVQACLSAPPAALLLPADLPSGVSPRITRALRRLQRACVLPAFPIIAMISIAAASADSVASVGDVDAFLERPLEISRVALELSRRIPRP